MIRTLVVAAALLVAVVLPGSALAAGPIQPGAYHETDVGACTLNFAYTGGGKTYMGTAAHCVGGAGQAVRDIDGETFGRVALVGNEDSTEADWAFIEVLPAAVSRVRAGVAGSPSYPTGVTTPSGTATGDLLQLSGHGLGFGTTQPTRERRSGVLEYDDAELYTLAGPVIFGDSGGPVVHNRTGKALGIVSRLCLGSCSEEGPTVQGILAKAAARGLNLTIRTP